MIKLLLLRFFVAGVALFVPMPLLMIFGENILTIIIYMICAAALGVFVNKKIQENL